MLNNFQPDLFASEEWNEYEDKLNSRRLEAELRQKEDSNGTKK